MMYATSEPWPTNGSKEEKEALIDAILDEPCMLDCMRDPTRSVKQTPYLQHINVTDDYHSFLMSTLRRVNAHRCDGLDSREIF